MWTEHFPWRTLAKLKKLIFKESSLKHEGRTKKKFCHLRGEREREFIL
jgi:hypothetical protein